MKNISIKAVIDFLLGASVFFIPVFPILPSILWIIIIVLWLFSGGAKQLNIKALWSRHVFILLLLYLVHVLGMLWTGDMDYGFRDLRIKLPMLIFPLFFLFFIPSERSTRFIKEGFVLGCLTACLFSFINASVKYSSTGDVNEFLYVNYSYLMFPGYFSMSINLAVIFILEALFNNRKVVLNAGKALLYLIIVFFMFNIILISEKMSMITAFIVVPLYVVAEAKKQNELKAHLKKLSLGFVLFLVVFVIYLNKYNRFTQIMEAIESFSEDSSPREREYYNSSTIRLAEWKYGYEIFMEHPLIGVGTGDIRNESMNKYVKEKFRYGIVHFETPASQYLHMAMILGVIGLAAILFAFFYPLLISLKNMDYVYAAFLLIYIFNCITGTILTASCVLIYGFFNAFLYYDMIRKRQKLMQG